VFGPELEVATCPLEMQFVQWSFEQSLAFVAQRSAFVPWRAIASEPAEWGPKPVFVVVLLVGWRFLARDLCREKGKLDPCFVLGLVLDQPVLHVLLHVLLALFLLALFLLVHPVVHLEQELRFGLVLEAVQYS